MNNFFIKPIKYLHLTKALPLDKQLIAINACINNYNHLQKNIVSFENYLELYKLLLTINDYKNLFLTSLHHYYFGFAALLFSKKHIKIQYNSLRLLADAINTEARWLLQQLALLINHSQQQFCLEQAVLIYQTYQALKSAFKLETRLSNQVVLLQHINQNHQQNLFGCSLKIYRQTLILIPSKTNLASNYKFAEFSYKSATLISPLLIKILATDDCASIGKNFFRLTVAIKKLQTTGIVKYFSNSNQLLIAYLKLAYRHKKRMGKLEGMFYNSKILNC